MRYLLSTLILAACASSALGDSDYCPLAIGNEWTMETTIISPGGEVSEGTTHFKINRPFLENGKPYMKNGKTFFSSLFWTDGLPEALWSRLDYPDRGGKIGLSFPYRYSGKRLRKDETGLYRLSTGKADDHEKIEVVLPLKVGTEWQRWFGGEGVTDTVTGIEMVSVLGKIYENCYHIRTTSRDGKYQEDSWEAPGVGNVKTEIVTRKGFKIILKLKKFRPA